MQHQRERPGDRSLLTGNLRWALFVLALPVLAEQFLNSAVGFVDTYLSGRVSDNVLLNRHATAAIGMAAYVGWLSSMIFGLVGIGTTALVARHWGAGRREQANRIANRSMLLAMLLGLAVCALFYFAAPLLVSALGMTGIRYRIAVQYLRIDAFGHIFHSLSMVGAAALRGSGDTRSPMFVLGTVSLLNVTASPLLMFGPGPIPELGIDGIVAGTVIARCTGGLLMLAVLFRGISGLRLSVTEMLTGGDDSLRRILRIGVPAGADGVVLWLGQVAFLKIINQVGDAQFAAHVISVQVEAITYLPAVAWGVAAATMTGQSLGSRNLDRARRAGREAVFQCSLLALGISALFVLGSGVIFRFMHTDPAVWAAGIAPFRFVGLFQVPLVWSIIYVHSLRGAGDTRFPMLINLFGTLLIRVPGAYLLAIWLGYGLWGAWIAMCADILVRAFLLAVRHRRGRWVATEV